MEIKVLNSQTIKLTLTTKDMKKYKITHEILKSNEVITKNLIIKLIETVKGLITIDLSKNKLFLESFKTKEKGCILYLSISNKNFEKTKQNPQTNTTTATIAFFKTPKDMKNFCKNILHIFPNIKFKSKLFTFNNKFILIIFATKNDEETILALIKEFGKLHGKGNVKYNIVKEHCSRIFKENAIKKILTSNF